MLWLADRASLPCAWPAWPADLLERAGAYTQVVAAGALLLGLAAAGVWGTEYARRTLAGGALAAQQGGGGSGGGGSGGLMRGLSLRTSLKPERLVEQEVE